MTAYKKGWLRASIAGGITSLLTLFLYLSGQPYQVNKSTFLTGLIVAIILATAPIYDDNRLSLKQQSLLHFSIMCVTILPILCLSGWYPLHNVVDFLKILAIPVLATMCKDNSSFNTICELHIVTVMPELAIITMLTINGCA